MITDTNAPITVLEFRGISAPKDPFKADMLILLSDGRYVRMNEEMCRALHQGLGEFIQGVDEAKKK